jgi:hypothetical protein
MTHTLLRTLAALLCASVLTIGTSSVLGAQNADVRALLAEAVEELEHVLEEIEETETAGTPSLTRAAAREVVEHGEELEEMLEEALAAAPAALKPEIQVALDSMKTVIQGAQAVQRASDADIASRVAELTRAAEVLEQRLMSASLAAEATSAAGPSKLPVAGGLTSLHVGLVMILASASLVAAGFFLKR